MTLPITWVSCGIKITTISTIILYRLHYHCYKVLQIFMYLLGSIMSVRPHQLMCYLEKRGWFYAEAILWRWSTILFTIRIRTLEVFQVSTNHCPTPTKINNMFSLFPSSGYGSRIWNVNYFSLHKYCFTCWAFSEFSV